MSDFLKVPSILACGGSWVAPRKLIDAGDFDAITRLARAAADTVARVRGVQAIG